MLSYKIYRLDVVSTYKWCNKYRQMKEAQGLTKINIWMVQRQHIAYAQNYNCGARYLQFTLLLIAIYYLQICNQEMDTKHSFLVQYMQHTVKRCELLLFYYYSICNIQLKDARITILFCGLWRTIPFPKNKHNSILI